MLEVLVMAVATNKTVITSIIIKGVHMAVGMVVSLVDMVMGAEVMSMISTMEVVKDNIIIRAMIIEPKQII